MVGAASSVKLVARLGTTKVVVLGLVGLAGALAVSLTWSADMPYWQLGLWFFAVAMSMGLIMSPATDSVMGSVPADKSGVASAMNDVTREVGGALGTAVIGSLIASLYSSRIADAVAQLPATMQSAAQDSIGKANAIAGQLPASQGADLRDAAASAFTEALGLGFAVAAACAIVAAIVVKVLLPARSAHAEPAITPVGVLRPETA
jgi:hypothetical protein